MRSSTCLAASAPRAPPTWSATPASAAVVPPVPGTCNRRSLTAREPRAQITAGRGRRARCHRQNDTWRFVYNKSRFFNSTWERAGPLDGGPRGRAFHSLTGVAGKLVLFGGTDDASQSQPLNDTWLFDPLTETWALMELPAGAPYPPARQGHLAAAVGDLLYIIGGEGAGRNGAAGAEAYACTAWCSRG